MMREREAIIICLKGGLGNQMFQYALYYKFKKLGKNVFLDLSLYRSKIEKRKYELGIFRNIVFDEATENECQCMRGGYKNVIDIILRKFDLKKYYYRERGGKFIGEIYDKNRIYLDGYWQNEKYFKDIRQDLLLQFQFPPLQHMENINVAKAIQETNSVSVHVRRGDYLNNKKTYGCLYQTDYYRNAIKYICDRIENAVFFVFSDDVEWTKKYFKGCQFVIVDFNRENQSYIDMQLMSLCKHNIIANSSFSWWAAWLNQFRDKIVIAPKFWTINKNIPDIVCDEWIVL